MKIYSAYLWIQLSAACLPAGVTFYFGFICSGVCVCGHEGVKGIFKMIVCVNEVVSPDL